MPALLYEGDEAEQVADFVDARRRPLSDPRALPPPLCGALSASQAASRDSRNFPPHLP